MALRTFQSRRDRESAWAAAICVLLKFEEAASAVLT
jgi:hypothetical protein